MPQTLPMRVGGRLALDFLNTAEGRQTSQFREFVPDYAALAHWSGSVGGAMPADGAILAALATTEPARAALAHRQAIGLRETLHAVFLAALTDDQVAKDDLDVVNTALAQATSHHVLRPAQQGGVRDGWTGRESLESPLWPIVIDAWDILTTDALRRVRECPGQACGWLFLDTSRSGTRRWCDMRTCGNRAKAANHYARQNPP